jgi:Flp pilus assembly pilin Flp
MQHLATWVAVNLQTTAARLRERQEGQTMAEYALILGLIAIAVILAVIFLREEIKNLFSRTGSSLKNSPD